MENNTQIEDDQKYMKLALDQAQKSLESGEVPVGCIFVGSDGKIVAAYDQNGKMLRTIEKFTNYQLPDQVMTAIKDRFPKWKVVKDVYRVSYHHKKGDAKKSYKVILENGDKRMKLKMDGDGNFM